MLAIGLATEDENARSLDGPRAVIARTFHPTCRDVLTSIVPRAILTADNAPAGDPHELAAAPASRDRRRRAVRIGGVRVCGPAHVSTTPFAYDRRQFRKRRL
jgi:hypothetical protein